MKTLEEIEAALSAPLKKEDIREVNKQEYVSGGDVILNLNNDVGPLGWEDELVSIEVETPRFEKREFVDKRTGAVEAKEGWTCSAHAVVRLTIHLPGGGKRCHDGAGADTSEMQPFPHMASKNAYKGAETDALKRAAVKLGPRYGLALRFKDRDDDREELGMVERDPKVEAALAKAREAQAAREAKAKEAAAAASPEGRKKAFEAATAEVHDLLGRIVDENKRAAALTAIGCVTTLEGVAAVRKKIAATLAAQSTTGGVPSPTPSPAGGVPAGSTTCGDTPDGASDASHDGKPLVGRGFVCGKAPGHAGEHGVYSREGGWTCWWRDVATRPSVTPPTSDPSPATSPQPSATPSVATESPPSPDASSVPSSPTSESTEQPASSPSTPAPSPTPSDDLAVDLSKQPNQRVMLTAGQGGSVAAPFPTIETGQGGSVAAPFPTIAGGTQPSVPGHGTVYGAKADEVRGEMKRVTPADKEEAVRETNEANYDAAATVGTGLHVALALMQGKAIDGTVSKMLAEGTTPAVAKDSGRLPPDPSADELVAVSWACEGASPAELCLLKASDPVPVPLRDAVVTRCKELLDRAELGGLWNALGMPGKGQLPNAYQLRLLAWVTGARVAKRAK